MTLISAANAYVSGMKEELDVVGNEYQTFTTMWTMSVTLHPSFYSIILENTN
jgi:hypothetical protein